MVDHRSADDAEPDADDDATTLPQSPERLRADESALLIVDVQQRLLPAIDQGRRIAWNCSRLVAGASALAVPLQATEQNPQKLGPLVAELRPAFPSPPAKMAFSCGACGEIWRSWCEQGVSQIVLAGIETHVCVLQTALDVLSAGLRVQVVVDAVGSRFPLDRDVALRRLESSGATLTTVEAVLFEWCQRAGTDAFRTISGLVKQSPPDAA